MTNVHEALSAQFLRWELRGRGWQSFDEAVALEPPFRPFEGHFLPRRPQFKVNEEGRFGSLVGNLLWKLRKAYSPSEEEIAAADGATYEFEEEPELLLWQREALIEFQIALPKERRFPRELMESFLLMVSGCDEPLAFEIMASAQEIVIQLGASKPDSLLVRKQLEAHFPDLLITEREAALTSEWSQSGDVFVAAEFGLTREFMLPLGTPKTDFFLGVIAAMSAAGEGEMLLYQVLFEPVRHPWAASALAAVSDGKGGPFFANRPELLPEARLKMQRPLYAVTLKIAASAATSERAWHLLAPAVTAMSAVERPGGNHLVPLASARLDDATLEEDLLKRHSHRLGMLLNIDELITLAHFPDESVQSSRLRADTGRTRAAPPGVETGGFFLGWNEHAGLRLPVSLTLEQRVRHMHLVGASGTGKSNLLFNLISTDIANGEGLTVIDPHGDLIDKVLGIIPPERTNDVILVDPADEGYSIGFNVLAAQGDLEKNLLASDLVSIFQRLSTSWGDQMASVLNYAILAFLESREGGTLVDLQRFLLEPDFRTRFLATVDDEHVVYYWKKSFTQLGGGKSIGPVLTRLGLFLSPKPIRYMVGQRENRLPFGELMDSGKIILARLPQGRMGKENSFLLGSLLVSKLQQAAMARQRVPEDQRRLHTLYVDEFQNFCTPSMAEILTGTRKYRVALVLAHQSLDQIKRHDEVGSAVLANAGTRVVFRVGDGDARELERGFAHFDGKVLQSLRIGEAIVRIERNDADFNISVPMAVPPNPAEAASVRNAVVEASRRDFAKPRTEIEQDLLGVPAKKTSTPPAAAPQTPVSKKTPGATPAEDLPSRTIPVIEEELHVAPLEKPCPPATAALPQGSTSEHPTASAEEPPARTTPPAPVSSPDAPAVAPEVAPVPIPVPYVPTSIRPSIEALGRGGMEHQAAQIELKRVAEGLGFRATIERQIPGSKEATDLYLERDGIAIACEISVTNTLEAEMRNVTKHLQARVPTVAVVCLEPEKLAKLKTALTNSLSAGHLARVLFFLKEEFISHLQYLSVEQSEAEPSPPSSKKQKGWKVTVTMAEATPEETKLREEQIAASLAASMEKRRVRRKKK